MSNLFDVENKNHLNFVSINKLMSLIKEDI